MITKDQSEKKNATKEHTFASFGFDMFSGFAGEHRSTSQEKSECDTGREGTSRTSRQRSQKVARHIAMSR
jgi:hypothetical protein